MTVLQTLIDKRDNFEVVRDQIAAILVAECENQKALALLADPPQDPSNYDFNVFLERSNPWEQYITSDDPDTTPIINVWYNSSGFDGSASSISERQKTEGVFNIDCYGAAISESTDDGHSPGDEKASREAQRILRLVRNILMASSNTYLQLRGLVWKRWPQSVTMFQPQGETRSNVHVVAGRLSLSVTFNEFSPQWVPETLEYVAIEIHQKESGQVMLGADYDYS